MIDKTHQLARRECQVWRLLLTDWHTLRQLAGTHARHGRAASHAYEYPGLSELVNHHRACYQELKGGHH